MPLGDILSIVGSSYCILSLSIHLVWWCGLQFSAGILPGIEQVLGSCKPVLQRWVVASVLFGLPFPCPLRYLLLRLGVQETRFQLRIVSFS